MQGHTHTILHLSPAPPVHSVGLSYQFLTRTILVTPQISPGGPRGMCPSLEAVWCGLGLEEALN